MIIVCRELLHETENEQDVNNSAEETITTAHSSGNYDRAVSEIIIVEQHGTKCHIPVRDEGWGWGVGRLPCEGQGIVNMTG
jgi:hypothetical protein